MKANIIAAVLLLGLLAFPALYLVGILVRVYG